MKTPPSPRLICLFFAFLVICMIAAPARAQDDASVFGKRTDNGETTPEPASNPPVDVQPVETKKTGFAKKLAELSKQYEGLISDEIQKQNKKDAAALERLFKKAVDAGNIEFSEKNLNGTESR